MNAAFSPDNKLLAVASDYGFARLWETATLRDVGDPTWENLDQFTPPWPSYSSAQATVCATSLTVLGDTFGDDYSFTMRTTSAPSGGPATRSFTSFSSAAVEAGLSRVYLGYHFRFDSETGVAAGTAISNHAADSYLQPR